MRQLLDITTAEYFKLPYASNSGIKEALKVMSGQDIPDDEGNRSYTFGSALDAILTDPNTLDTTGLTDDEVKLLYPMCRAIERDATYNALFRGNHSQKVWVDTTMPISFEGINTTIPAKCKYDWWYPRKDFGGDLKSTLTKTEEAFRKAAEWFDYDMQAAWYMDVTQTDRFVIIAVSKANFRTFTLSFKRGDESYESGKAKYLKCAAAWWKLYGHRAI